MISCIKNILEIAQSNPTVGKTFFYNPANFVAEFALDYGGFPLELSIRNRNYRGNQRSINQAPRGKRAYDGFNQPEVWSQNPQYYMDEWSQPMANANYPIANQQLPNYQGYQSPSNYNQSSSFQQSSPVQYYVDPSGLAPGANCSLYNSNDLIGGSLNQLNSAGTLGAAALSTNPIKTFWNSSYNGYNGEDRKNFNVPINVDGRMNMT